MPLRRKSCNIYRDSSVILMGGDSSSFQDYTEVSVALPGNYDRVQHCILVEPNTPAPSSDTNHLLVPRGETYLTGSYFFCLMFGFVCFQWKEAKPDDLMDSKLRCVFEMPNENDKLVSRKIGSCFNKLSVTLRLIFLLIFVGCIIMVIPLCKTQ